MKLNFYLFILTVFLTLSTFSYTQEWVACNNGLPSPNIRAMAINNDTIVIGLTNNGLFKSYDFGQTWVSFTNNLTDKNITRLTIKDNDVYVATMKNGLYFTSDMGNTWINKGLTEYNIYDILIDDGYIYTCGNGGIFKSTDNGSNWDEVNNGLKSLDILKLNMIGNKIISGSVSTGFYTLDVDGNEWLQKNSGLQYKMIRDINTDGNNIYLATCDEAFTLNGGIYFSNDDGVTWLDINTDMTRKMILSITTADNKIFAGGSKGNVFFTQDNGVNWENISTGLPANPVSNLAVLGNFLFATIQNTGVYKLDISAVSVNDNFSDNVLNISPNPAFDFITVTLGDINPMLKHRVDEISIEIYNTLGEKVMSVGTGRDLYNRINISDLPKGMYVIKFCDKTAKFMKM